MAIRENPCCISVYATNWKLIFNWKFWFLLFNVTIELIYLLDLVSIALACEVLGNQAVYSDFIIFEINILKLLPILQNVLTVASFLKLLFMQD